jgi:hypothetical protein
VKSATSETSLQEAPAKGGRLEPDHGGTGRCA